MSVRTVVVASVGPLIVLGVLVVALQWLGSGSVLTVYLRCDRGMSGTLLVAVVEQVGQQGRRASFDLDASCRSGKATFPGYVREQSLRWVLVRGDVTTAEVVSTYSRDIQSDRDGFYVVLKLTNTPPFIAGDRI